MTRASQDVLPFVKTVGTDTVKTYGVNAIGLRRKGFPEDRIERLKEIFRRLTGPKWNTSQALDRIEEDFPGDPDAEDVVEFVRSARRGVHK